MHCAIRHGSIQALVSACVLVGVAACGSALSAASPEATPTASAVAPAATATPSSTPSLVPATPTPAPSTTPSPTPTPSLTPTPWPTPDALADGRQVRLPILMYHYVEPWPPGAGEIRKNLTVRPEDFAAQMQALHERGYQTVSLYDLLYTLTRGWPLPPKAVVLTFDDGYRSLVEHAVPTMQAYGYTGTVFVITELMDKGLDQYLTWPQAERLYASGWKVEPHTKTHHQLQGRSRDFQLYQMLGSVQTVQAHIGVMPRFFNYPSGKYDALTLQLNREIGLWGAVTVDFGRMHTVSSLHTLRRVRVSGQGSLRDFLNGLEGDLRP